MDLAKLNKAFTLAVISSITLSCALRASDKIENRSVVQLTAEVQIAKVNCKVFDRTPKKEFVLAQAMNSLKKSEVPAKEVDHDLVSRQALVVGTASQKVDLSDARYYAHLGVYTGNFQIGIYDRKNQDYLAMAEGAEHGFTSLSLLLKDPVVDVKCELLPSDPTNAK